MKRWLFGLFLCSFLLVNMGAVMAQSLDDDVGTGSNGIATYIENHEPISNDQMTSANKIAAPVVNLIGKIAGVLLIVVISGVALITVLDLVYIGIPPVRGFMYSGGTTSGNAAGGMGMGNQYGGSGHYGGSHYGGGGYGMGNQQQQQNTGQVSSFGGKQWVSDEAVDCVAQAGGSANMGNQQMVGGADGTMQPQGTKSVILMYLKRRTVFLVIFAVCSVVLLSSALMGVGVNLAEWGIKLLETFNGYRP